MDIRVDIATITPVKRSGKPTGTVTFLTVSRVLHTARLRRGRYTTSAFALGVGRNHHGQLLREQHQLHVHSLQTVTKIRPR